MENSALTIPRKTLPLWLRLLTGIVFLFSVNLLAGYIGVRFNYPSLFSVDPTFVEYAVPLPYNK